MKHEQLHLVRRASVALSVLLCASPTFGQDNPSPISTDRPGFLFSPVVVPAGSTQIEVGLPTYVSSRASDQESTSWSAPIALRYGLNAELELRASLPTWTAQRIESAGQVEHDRGFADAEIGVKYALNATSESSLALQASVRLPTGEAPFSSNELGETAYLLHGRSLGADWSATFLAGVLHTPVDNGADTTQGALGVLASHPIGDGWSGYGELTALPGLNNARGQVYAGLGATWTLSNDLQLDVSADFGLDDDSADVIAGLGISYRL